VSEQKDHRREETERDVANKVGSLPSEDRCGGEPEKADSDRRDQRLSQDAIISDLPSPFVVEWVPRVTALIDRTRAGTDQVGPGSRRALDLAMGRGRHARLLARAGFLTFGVDVHLNAVRDAMARARDEGLAIRGWCTDLTAGQLPSGLFDVVVVTRYLQRDLFPSIRGALKAGARGGVILYETFTVNQRRHGRGPTSPEHLLEPDELARHFAGFDVLFYEEVESPEAVARIVARRTSSS
jgi:tellurite methyltransferase